MERDILPVDSDGPQLPTGANRRKESRAGGERGSRASEDAVVWPVREMHDKAAQ
jgi:hypothetical protein